MLPTYAAAQLAAIALWIRYPKALPEWAFFMPTTLLIIHVLACLATLTGALWRMRVEMRAQMRTFRNVLRRKRPTAGPEQRPNLLYGPGKGGLGLGGNR